MPTIYEDWLARREEISRLQAAPGAEAWRLEPQARILDFLLERYRHEPETAEPAAVPAPTETFFNRRAVLVHHSRHPEQKKIASAADARERIRDFYSRQREPEHEPPAAVPAPPPLPRAPGYVNEQARKLQTSLGWALRLDRGADIVFEKFLYFGIEPPEAALDWICRSLEAGRDPEWCLRVLPYCHSEDAADFLADTWRHLLSVDWRGPAVPRLSEMLADHSKRARVLEQLRDSLGSTYAAVRLGALRLLEMTGALREITLLLALLDLPRQDDEAPGEREAIERTIRGIAEGKRYRPPLSMAELPLFEPERYAPFNYRLLLALILFPALLFLSYFLLSRVFRAF